MQSTYVIQNAYKTHCPKCSGPVALLCHEMMSKRSPMFYICWTCRWVTQVGKGPVQVQT